jgi:hypothetical protein
MVNYRPLGGFSLMFYGQLEEKALQVVPKQFAESGDGRPEFRVVL